MGIIPRKQFERVQLIRAMRRVKSVGDDSDMGQCNQYPLGQKLRCPFCGSVLYQRAVEVQTDHSKGWCCERGENPCGKFVIRSRLVEPALLKAYELVDLDAVREKQKDPKHSKDAKLLLSMKKKTPVFESVDYWWVDDLIDHIEFGKHSMDARELMRMRVLGKDAADDRTMRVFWRCGLVTTVPSGILEERDNPVKLAEMHRRVMKRKQKKKEAEAE